MHRTTMTAAAAAALSAGLVLGTPTTALAAVSAKDAVSQSDFVKVLPELDGGTFKATKGKELAGPGMTCGSTSPLKVKSTVTNTGVGATGYPAVASTASELPSKAKAKSYLASYAKFVKGCSTFVEPATGASVTIQKVTAPKVGKSAIATTQTVDVGGVIAYSASVVILDGTRVAQVAVVDDAAVSSQQINALAKVAAKKLK